MKIGSGSSPHFVVTAVVFEDLDEANRCDAQIETLRKKLDRPPAWEFHFAHERDEVRDLFLRETASFDFWFKSFVLNKAKCRGPGFQYSDSCYKYPLKLLFGNLRPMISDAHVIVDSRGDRRFRQQLAQYLKQHVNNADGPCTIRKLSSKRSDGNNLLQLADMVCGAVARCFTCDRHDRRKFRNLLKSKDFGVQVWPK